ncbi:TrbI/VirB10 family protein [Jannaschia sp. 2305UL9-9]|uniref:TrbI/VirB10 family protein n=1 Tax=Jannaschia sp. 2305UL9-9 TaxID=3121638 RepID=UPI00352870A0
MAETEDRRRRTGGTPAWAKGLLGLALLVVIGLLAYPIVFPEGPPRIITSGTDEFQDERDDGRGIGRIAPEDGDTTVIVERESFDIGPITDQLDAQAEELERRNAALQENIAALQDELRGLNEAAEAEQATLAQQLAAALAEAQEQNAASIEQLTGEFQNQLARQAAEAEDRASEQDGLIRSLAEQNERLEALLQARPAGPDATETERRLRLESELRREEEAAREARALEAELAREAQRLDLERQRQMEAERQRLARIEEEQRRAALADESSRRAELEARRAEQQALREARIESPGVIFDQRAIGASANGSPGAATDSGLTAANGPFGQGRLPSRDELQRGFVSAVGGGTEASVAEFIANPSNTVLQGTLIEASLETAIDSALPGPVVAMVTRPIWSFDGSQVLVPPGSRLFGQYSSDVSLGQSRILVGWQRIVTPDGQSVRISAFGGDAQGRSGLTGDVDSRFFQRFGGAALISLVSAAPAIAAANADSEVEVQIGEDVTGNLVGATSSAVEQYATLPPVIRVDIGSAVTVIVDRDIELFSQLDPAFVGASGFGTGLPLK